MRAVLLVGLLVGCSGDSGPPAPGDPVAGAVIYKTYCASCHQADGTGRPPNGVALGASFIGPESRLNKEDATLLQAIKGGTSGQIGMMPPFSGVLTAQERRDTLAHIRAAYGAEASL